MKRELLGSHAMLLTLAVSAIGLFPAYPAATPEPEWPTPRMKFEKIATKSSSSMIGIPETGKSIYRSHANQKGRAEEAKFMKSLNTLNELRMNVTYSSSWDNSGIYLPTGIYSMPVSGGEMELFSPKDLCGASFLIGNFGACYIDNQYNYLCTYNGDTGSGSLSATYILSTQTWEPIGQIGDSQSVDGLTPFTLAYDPSTGADFYAVFYNENMEGYHFGKLNIGQAAPGSSVIKEIASNAECMASLGFTPDGKLYAINLEGTFCSVDKNTGVITKMFETGIFQTSSFGMAYNESDGCFYTFDQCAEPDESDLSASTTLLKKINPESHSVETVYEIEGYLQAKGLYIDQVIPDGKAPAAVIELSADFSGTLEGILSFTAPSLSVDGTPLTEKMEFEVYQDEVSIEKGSISPGEQHTLTVSAPDSRDITFQVLVKNENGYGESAKTTAWAGEYIPSPARITNLKVTENPEHPGEMTLTWDPISVDTDGNPINIENYWYVIKAYVDGSDALSVIADKLTECSYTYQAVETGQQFVSYRVMPASRMEEYSSSAAWSDDYCVGTPMTLPYLEDFEDADVVNRDWLFNGSDAQFSGIANGILPDNGDYYLAVMAPWNAVNEPHAEIYSGKIDLGNAVKPTLSFRYYGIREQINMILVQAIVAGEGNMIGFLMSNPPETGWQEETIDLSEYAGKEIQISFTTDLSEKRNYMVFDDIRIYDAAAPNLALTGLSAPTMTAGKESIVSIKVKNTSDNAFSSDEWSVELYANDVRVGNVTGRALDPKNECDIEIMVTPDNSWYVDNRLSAVLTSEADRNITDNTRLINHVKCSFPSLPAPTGLSGVINDGVATMTWEAPDTQSTAEITEDFEAYAPYSISSFGNWKDIDVDGLGTYGIAGQFGDLYFHNNYKPHAFIVFSDEQFGYQWSQSPSQFLASIANYEDPAKEDNWLISPELCGKSQTVALSAKVMFSDYDADIEILSSATDNDIESFTPIKEINVNSSLWTGYEVALPEGTKYFAIRVKANKYMVMFDDVTYTPAACDATLLGYNLYADDIKINDGLLKEAAYTGPGKKNTLYSVSAVYDKGESPLSEAVTMEGSGIRDTAAAFPSVHCSHGVIVIENAAGATADIYSTDGRLIFRSSGRETYRVTVVPGIYVVRAAGRTWKVMAD